MPLNPQELAVILKELSDALEDLATIIGEQKEIDKDFEKKLRQFLKKIPAKYAPPSETLSPRKALKKAYRKNFLRLWLTERNFKIGKAIDNFRGDERLFKAAEFLADHYHRLEDFYKQLKINQSRRKENMLFLSSKETIQYIRKWAEMLVKAKLIDGFRKISGNQVDVDLALIKEATEFVNGFWLEIFLRRELANFLMTHYQEIKAFDILADIHVTYPDHTAGELDLLLMINEHVFWFECKSGQIGEEYYRKYGKINHNFLHLHDGHSALLLPKMNLHQPAVIKKRTGMEPLFATELDIQLPKLLDKALT